MPCGQYRDFRHTQQCPTPLQAFLAIYSHLHINVHVPATPARRTPRPSRLAQTLPPATCSVPFVHCRPSARASRTCSTLSISHQRYVTPAKHNGTFRCVHPRSCACVCIHVRQALSPAAHSMRSCRGPGFADPLALPKSRASQQLAEESGFWAKGTGSHEREVVDSLLGNSLFGNSLWEEPVVVLAPNAGTALL